MSESRSLDRTSQGRFQLKRKVTVAVNLSSPADPSLYNPRQWPGQALSPGRQAQGSPGQGAGPGPRQPWSCPCWEVGGGRGTVARGSKWGEDLITEIDEPRSREAGTCPGHRLVLESRLLILSQLSSPCQG